VKPVLRGYASMMSQGFHMGFGELCHQEKRGKL